MILVLNVLFVFIFMSLGLVLHCLKRKGSDCFIYTDIDPRNEDAIKALEENKKDIGFVVDMIICVISIVFTLCLFVNLEIQSLQPKIEYEYKAELKSGEVVEARDCYTVNDKAICEIKIDGDEDKEYIVTSYRDKTLVESMFE